MVDCVMPCSANSWSLSWECVVLAGVDDQRFDIGYIGQQGEYLQVVDEAVRFCTSALDFKREDGAGSFGKIFLIKGWESVLRKGGVVDLFTLG